MWQHISVGWCVYTSVDIIYSLNMHGTTIKKKKKKKKNYKNNVTNVVYAFYFLCHSTVVIA
jgi:hypothetical protein